MASGGQVPRSTLMIALMACSGGGADSDGTRIEGAEVDVVAVRATGDAGAYTFYVSLQSDETGCEQYADWWEVTDPSGELLYRRILDHSHPDEQPFERSGGPVAVGAATEVVVRGHLHPQGYVGAAMHGSVSAGFSAFQTDPGFGAALEQTEPLPQSCLF